MKLKKLQENEKYSPFALIVTLLLFVYAFSLIFMLVWAFFSAIKSRSDFFYFPMQIQKKFHFENFTAAFEVLSVSVKYGQTTRQAYLFEMFVWTITYSIGTCIVAQITRCVSAYICAKFSKYRFTKWMYNVVIVVMILPIVGNLASSLTVYRSLGVYDNLFLHILCSAGFTGTYFLIYYAAFQNVSWSYAEAAFIDGAGHFRVFFTIMLPMVRNMMGGLFLLEFIGLWNDYTAPMIYLPSYPTVAYGLYRFMNSDLNAASSENVQLAASLLVATPIILLYCIFNKQLIGNISVGGLKG